MIHKMKLNDKPFNSIEEGTKTVELRLNDEKRQQLKVKDYIEFTNRETSKKLLTEVIDLHKYPSFEELFKHFDKKDLGYDEDEVADPADMDEYYSKEEQDKYGVVGIKIKKL
ncbi:MAG: ASCH domain-containing protein [Bacilli bacterium]|nr:ASCH domain-containing protein [Bacilli bacterium]MBR3162400.1 ASCH domain-containing protein [Bacilli bacterium]